MAFSLQLQRSAPLLALLALAAPRAARADAPAASTDVAALVERSRASVVQVVALVPGAGDDAPLTATASGFVAGPGQVVTTERAVRGALSLTVRLADGRQVTARLMGADERMDVALVQAETGATPAARLADAASAVGSSVVAVSWLAPGRAALTTGLVGAPGRGGWGSGTAGDLLLADVGSAGDGAPLLNPAGAVIGLQSLTLGARAQRAGAVTAGTLRRLIGALARGKVERPHAGASTQDLTAPLAEALGSPGVRGVALSHVEPASPAAQAHLKAGDIVAALDGKPLLGADDFEAEVMARSPGAPVVLEVVRSGKRYSTTLTLGARLESTPPPPVVKAGKGLGLTLQDVPVREKPGPALCAVESVAEGSAARLSGVLGGDLILEAGSVTRPTCAQTREQGAAGRLLVRVQTRGESPRYVVLR